MRRIFLRLSILILTLLIGLASYVAWSNHHPPFTRGKDNPAPYRILRDEMGTIVTIGIDANVSERELCATMSRAADEHMNDAARDYLVSEFLWTEAYLIKDGRQSALPAGKLRRYVPPRNPNAKESPSPLDLFIQSDQYTMSYDAAKASFQ